MIASRFKFVKKFDLTNNDAKMGSHTEGVASNNDLERARL
jgi:hypothetical protein